MGRYWLLLSSGEFPVPPMSGEVNININLQVAHGAMGDVPEAMAPYYDWLESLPPDCLTTATNTFGARGAVYTLMPTTAWGFRAVELGEGNECGSMFRSRGCP